MSNILKMQKNCQKQEKKYLQIIQNLNFLQISDLLSEAGISKSLFELEIMKKIGFSCFFNYIRGALDFSGAIKLAQSTAVALGIIQHGQTQITFPKYWNDL